MKQHQASIKYCWNSMTKMMNELRLIVAYLDGLQGKVNALRELQSASGEELRPLFGRTLMPSVLRPQGGAFRGEL